MPRTWQGGACVGSLPAGKTFGLSAVRARPFVLTILPGPGYASFRNHWSLVREQSVFCDWQRLKVQEAVEEVGPGLQGLGFNHCFHLVAMLLTLRRLSTNGTGTNRSLAHVPTPLHTRKP